MPLYRLSIICLGKWMPCHTLRANLFNRRRHPGLFSMPLALFCSYSDSKSISRVSNKIRIVVSIQMRCFFPRPHVPNLLAGFLQLMRGYHQSVSSSCRSVKPWMEQQLTDWHLPGGGGESRWQRASRGRWPMPRLTLPLLRDRPLYSTGKPVFTSTQPLFLQATLTWIHL
jgi:hypothetical protein